MENCVSCNSPETSVPVSTGDCGCGVSCSGEVRDVRLIAPTSDVYENWVTNDPLVPKGVFCLVKDRLFDGSVEYFVGDGKKLFSESLSFAGAPLSRTGKEDCSPLAENGKMSLDPSWLPVATEISYGAVKASVSHVAGTAVIRGENGEMDWESLPDATAVSKGAVKASTAGGAGLAILGDAEGKYLFGDNASLNVSCIEAGSLPDGVTINGSAVVGDISGNAAAADHAVRADSAAAADKVSHSFTVNGTVFDGSADRSVTFSADGGRAASCSGNSASATKLATARNITVKITLNGNTLSGTAAFDGTNNITINLGSLTKEQLGYSTSSSGGSSCTSDCSDNDPCGGDMGESGPDSD